MTTEYIGIYIGIIGIILGALISLYFYRRSIRLKEPYWSIISNNLIEGYSTKVENLKVIYKGEEVNNLTISRILFWNGGRETLENKDIETVNRIRITGKKGLKFLDAKILKSNNQSSQCSADTSEDGNYINLNFDYLDEKQGFIVQAIHTGTKSEDIKIIGDIRGVKSIKKRISNQPLGKEKGIFLGLMLITIMFSLFFLALGIVLTVNPSTILASPGTSQSHIQNSLIPVFSRGGGIMFILMSIVFLTFVSTQLGRYRITPKGLDIFQSEWFKSQ